MLLVLATLLACTLAQDKPFPKLSEQFSMQINLTSSAGSVWAGVETVAFDLVNLRSHIFVSGPQYQPPFGQLIIGHSTSIDKPNGWFAQYAQTGSTWECKNQSITEQWAPFWTMPAGTAYVGQATVYGVLCNQWKSPEDQGQSALISLCAKDNTPVANSIFTASGKRFDYQYFDYKEGAPPASAFTLPKGTVCTQQSSNVENSWPHLANFSTRR